MVNFKQILVNSDILRTLTFPLLRHLNFEITISHDITKRPLTILSWLHKGYWFYNSSREEQEIERFQQLINEGGWC